MPKKELNNSRKITKVALVIYSSIMLALFFVFLTVSLTLKTMTYLYGYLLCLGPSLIFVFLSVILSAELLLKTGTSKGVIFGHVVLYVLKYAIIFGIPIIGIGKPALFDRGAMLATTLIAPITIIIVKLIFANYVSKKNKK